MDHHDNKALQKFYDAYFSQTRKQAKKKESAGYNSVIVSISSSVVSKGGCIYFCTTAVISFRILEMMSCGVR